MPSQPFDEEVVFKAACNLESPQARADYLKQVCGEDQARLDRMATLLRAHEGAAGFLESPPQGYATVDLPPVSERPGTVIGAFKLLEQIGEGGFGVVFLAEQTQPVRRKVALKVLKPGMDTRQVIARFEAERQALAIMDHPNIAKVFDGGATPSGRPYFVMELVKGVPITVFCDQNHLTPRQRLELFVPVCQAVQHAHQKGIIHRDLKPSNVLVTVHDTTPVVKVIDFGVAKALGQELTDKTLFTGFAQMIGTPLYMSPEQAGQSGLDIDTRSDIYSLGVLLYELLTGTTPFSKERFKQAAYDEIRRIIREEEPPKPSTRLSELSSPLAPREDSGSAKAPTSSLASVAALRHTEPAKLTKLVRGELDWIVMKALDKDRNRRYETANGFAMDLQRYLADEPVQACPPSAGYRLKKLVRRYKAPLVAATIVLVLLVGGIVGTSWGLVVADQAIEAETKQREQAEEQRDLAKKAEVRATDFGNAAIKSSNEANEASNAAIKSSKEANEARNAAILARNEANDARENELHQLYAADMLLASRALIDGPLARAIDLLDAWLPERRDGKDYRGREWHMLRRLSATSEKTLVGHDGPLHALAWTGDGKRIASGGADRIIRVWDAESGQCVQTLIGHSAGVFDVAFSPDGKLLASAAGDSTVRLWEIDSGKERHVLRGHILSVYTVAFHPDGTRFASAGADSMIKVWDTATGAEVFALQGHDTPVGRLQFDTDGKKLASCGIIRGTMIWDLETRKVVDRLNRTGSIVFTVHQTLQWVKI